MALGTVVVVGRVVVGRLVVGRVVVGRAVVGGVTVVEVPVEVVAGGTVVAVVVDGAVVAVVVAAAPAGGGPAGPYKPPRPTTRAKPLASLEHHGPLALLGPAFFNLLFATTGAQRGARRSVKPCPPRVRQIMPSLSALRTQGITSSSISSSGVVAAKPKTCFALSTEGTRLATSCSNGGSLT